MKKKITSIPTFYGTIEHFDESGSKVGESIQGLVEGVWEHQDASGNPAGYSMPGAFEDMSHYDESGYQVASIINGLFGEQNHYGPDGDLIGTTFDTVSGFDTSLDFEADSFDL